MSLLCSPDPAQPAGSMDVLADAEILCRLLDKIAKDIMVCENKTVTRWDGSIGDYKKHLRKKMIANGGV